MRTLRRALSSPQLPGQSTHDSWSQGTQTLPGQQRAQVEEAVEKRRLWRGEGHRGWAYPRKKQRWTNRARLLGEVPGEGRNPLKSSQRHRPYSVPHEPEGPGLRMSLPKEAEEFRTRPTGLAILPSGISTEALGEGVS